MAICDVMHRLPQCPSAFTVRCVELYVAETVYRFSQFFGKDGDRSDVRRSRRKACRIKLSYGKAWVKAHSDFLTAWYEVEKFYHAKKCLKNVAGSRVSLVLFRVS